MENKIILIIFMFMITLTGCENIDVSKLSDEDLERISEKAVVCDKPYIRVGMECCLDKNDNSICDKDETEIKPEEKDYIVFSGTVDVKKISDKGNHAKVSDKYVVWKTSFYNRTSENIAVYNIETGEIKNLNIRVRFDWNFNLYSNKLAYFPRTGGGIYFYDLDTDENERIVDAVDGRYINFNDKYVVWGEQASHKGNNIFLYDIKKKKKLQLVDSSGTRPKLYGDKVFWVDARDWSGFARADIYMYDIKSGKEEKLTKKLISISESIISVYGDKIAYSDNQIFIYDLNTKEEKQITKGDYQHLHPSIHKNLIVWEDYRNFVFIPYSDDEMIRDENTDIFLYDLKTDKEFAITTEKTQDIRPQIHGNHVVWDTKQGIYLATLK